MPIPRNRTLLVMSLPCLVLIACSGGDGTEETEALSAQDPEPVADATPAAESSTPEAPATASASTSELSDTAWKLVRISSMDDSVAEPAPAAEYSVAFNADGSASFQVDCNRGAGSWKSASPGQLAFGPLALTRAMCPPGSIHDQFVRELEYVRSYVIRDGHLHLATMADGSILEFQPVD